MPPWRRGVRRARRARGRCTRPRRRRGSLSAASSPSGGELEPDVLRDEAQEAHGAAPQSTQQHATDVRHSVVGALALPVPHVDADVRHVDHVEGELLGLREPALLVVAGLVADGDVRDGAGPVEGPRLGRDPAIRLEGGDHVEAPGEDRELQVEPRLLRHRPGIEVQALARLEADHELGGRPSQSPLSSIASSPSSTIRPLRSMEGCA